MTTPRTDSFEEWLRKWPYDTDLDPEAAWNASRKGAENKIETLTKALEEAEQVLSGHDKYLDYNDLTTIGNNSFGHLEIKHYFLNKKRKALAQIKE